MGFIFAAPPVDFNGNRGVGGGLVIDLQMNTSVSQSYFGHEKVFPHYPFPSESIVAWWSNIIPPITSSTGLFIEWESYYSRTGNTYYLTGSTNSIEYVGGPNSAKFVYHFGNYAYTNLNNIFTTSSTATIVLVGNTGAYSPFQNRRESWFGMTGDADYYIGIRGAPNAYTLKRDEDGGATTWFGNPLTATLMMSFTYNGSTGLYSAYDYDLGVTTATRSGAPNRLGSTQQLRIGGWDTVGTSQLFSWWDCIVLDIEPTVSQLQSWSALSLNTYHKSY